jgi:hypothetical protein
MIFRYCYYSYEQCRVTKNNQVTKTQIPDPTTATKEGKTFVVLSFFVAPNMTKKFKPFQKEL